MSSNLTAGKPTTPRSKAHPRRADRLRLVLDGSKHFGSPLLESKQNMCKMAGNIVSRSVPSSPQSTRSISSATADSWNERSRIRSSWREEKRNQRLREHFTEGSLNHSLDSLKYKQGVTDPFLHNTETNLKKKKTLQSNLHIDTEFEEAEHMDVVNHTLTAAEEEEIRLKVQSVIFNARSLETNERNGITRIQAVRRGNLDRKNYSLQVSSLKIQTIWRGYRARRDRKAFLLKISLERFAATKLQAVWRMFRLQAMFNRYIAARKIQSRWKAYVCRMQYWLYLRSKEAAIKIQSAWRSFSCSRAFALSIYDVIFVQSLARGYIVRRKMLRDRGAVDIQRLYRGHKCRMAFRKVWAHHIKNKSALYIQRVYRGVVVRRIVARARVLMGASVKIQTSWRRYAAQLKLWICLGCIIHIQKIYRGFLARNYFLDELGRVILTQMVARRWLAYRTCDRIRTTKLEIAASTIIQASVRRFICRQSFLKYKREKLAATKIQSQWRCFICCTDYIFTIADIVTIQRFTRAIIKRRKAAIQIQSAWRRHVCYEDYCMIQHDVMTIQRVVRGYFGRNIYARKVEEFNRQQAYEHSRQMGAISMQRLLRGWRGRRDVLQLRQENQKRFSATLIQSKWRAYRAQRDLWQKIKCAIQIQSWSRCVFRRTEYIDCIGSIILSQCAVRCWLARRALLHKILLNDVCYFCTQREFVEYSAAIRIQSLYRNHIRPRLHNAAATKVQSFFRMVRAIIDRQVAMEMKRRSLQARRRKAAAVVIQSAYRKIVAVRERELRFWKRIREFSAITIQTYYRRFHAVKKVAALFREKRQNLAAVQIQSFFRMVKAMVDREIKIVMKKRKIRKMLRNRTKEIDDLMLEEAWNEMPISLHSVRNPTISLTPNVSASQMTSTIRKVPRPAKMDVIPHLAIAASNSNDSLLEKAWKSIPLGGKTMDKTNGSGFRQMSKCVSRNKEMNQVSVSNFGNSSRSTKHRSNKEAWSCISLSEDSLLEVKLDAMKNVVKQRKSSGVSLKENKKNQNNKINHRSKTKVSETIDASVLSPKKEFDTNVRRPAHEIRVCYSHDISDTISEVSSSTYGSSAFLSQGFEKSNPSSKRRSHVQPILALRNAPRKEDTNSLHVATSDSSRRSN
jgi:hypothetical protein